MNETKVKTVFLISGLRLNVTTTHEKYRPLSEGLNQKGYKVVPVDINWKHKSVSQFVAEFKNIYRANSSQYNIVVGNSFGAVVAFVSAADLKPDLVILASLSPYFKEDISVEEGYKRGLRFGTKRLKDMMNYSAKAVAKNINATEVYTKLLYGELEKQTVPYLVSRVKKTANDLEREELIEVKAAPHSMSDPVYIQAIIDLL